MPLIHVYTFSTKDELQETTPHPDDGDVNQESKLAADKICEAIGEQLGYKMLPGNIEQDGGVEIYDVRDVAPNKRMFCASFRLPEAVAFQGVEP